MNLAADDADFCSPCDVQLPTFDTAVSLLTALSCLVGDGMSSETFCNSFKELRLAASVAAAAAGDP